MESEFIESETEKYVWAGKCRKYHESSKHWSIRLEFLKKNFDYGDKNRLECLSLCYTNMLFLGARYPIETTQEIFDLAAGMKPIDQIVKQGLENYGKISNKRKIENDYIIPEKKRLLLRNPLEFIKSKTIVSVLREGTVIEPDANTLSENHEKPKWLKPKKSKFLLDNQNQITGNQNQIPEFSLKLISTTLAGLAHCKERSPQINIKNQTQAIVEKGRNKVTSTPKTFVDQIDDHSNDQTNSRAVREQYCSATEHVKITDEQKKNLSMLLRAANRNPVLYGRNYHDNLETVFKKAGLDLEVVIFPIRKILSDFKAFLESKTMKINRIPSQLEFHGNYKCCIVSCLGIELGYAVNINSEIARDWAIRNATQNLRTVDIQLISSARVLNIDNVVCQLTIGSKALSAEISKVGYLPPKPDTVVTQAKRVLNSVNELTVFIRGEMDVFSVVSRTANLNGYQEVYNQDWDPKGCSTILTIGHLEICRGFGENKKLSKRDAATKGAALLKQKCRIVYETVKVDMEAVSLQDLTSKGDPNSSNSGFHNDKGALLMKLMGWKGGGLGQNEDGRTEIVEHNAPRSGRDRGCIGTGADGRAKVTREQAEVIVAKYAQSNIMEDIAFSTELGNEERKIIHRGAQKYGLRSKSYGKGAERHLVLGRTPKQKLLFLQSSAKKE